MVTEEMHFATLGPCAIMYLHAFVFVVLFLHSYDGVVTFQVSIFKNIITDNEG